MLPSLTDLGSGRIRHYIHNPTQPTVLKVVKPPELLDVTARKIPPCAAHDEFSHAIIADSQGKETYMMPTRMNVVRFIQDLWAEHTEQHESACPSEETILAAFDNFFKYNKS